MDLQWKTEVVGQLHGHNSQFPCVCLPHSLTLSLNGPECFLLDVMGRETPRVLCVPVPLLGNVRELVGGTLPILLLLLLFLFPHVLFQARVPPPVTLSHTEGGHELMHPTKEGRKAMALVLTGWRGEWAPCPSNLLLLVQQQQLDHGALFQPESVGTPLHWLFYLPSRMLCSLLTDLEFEGSPVLFPS